jgi:pimeloyl-ACP methyl ester carboxylesterase
MSSWYKEDFISYRVYHSEKDDTLVFLHGYADAMDMFYPFVDNFEDYKIILINFPMKKEVLVLLI